MTTSFVSNISKGPWGTSIALQKGNILIETDKEDCGVQVGSQVETGMLSGLLCIRTLECILCIHSKIPPEDGGCPIFLFNKK